MYIVCIDMFMVALVQDCCPFFVFIHVVQRRTVRRNTEHVPCWIHQMKASDFTL